jgi:nicotinamidase-related amidase
MTDNIQFHPSETALLCMDYQSAIVAAYGGDGADNLLSRATNVLAKARKRGMPVIYIQVGFRPGFPEISDRNLMFSTIKSDPQRRQMFDGPAREIHPAVAPQDGDIVITKHRVSAFAGTDLDMILRANKIDTLVLFGIATSGVVLSTLIHAVDEDYKLFVIEDLCADGDQELHASLTRFYARRGTVISSSEFVNAIATSK